jgi:hypothetical protein
MKRRSQGEPLTGDDLGGTHGISLVRLPLS